MSKSQIRTTFTDGRQTGPGTGDARKMMHDNDSKASSGKAPVNTTFKDGRANVKKA